MPRATPYHPGRRSLLPSALTKRTASLTLRLRGAVTRLAVVSVALLALVIAGLIFADPATARRRRRKVAPVRRPHSLVGRVNLRGRGMSRKRPIRVALSTAFPLFATPADHTAKTDPDGSFIFEGLPEGTYWVVAYIDDNGDGRRNPGEICGFPRLAPVFLGPRHRHERISITLDPIHAVLATRFLRGSTRGHPSRLELAFAALYVRHPTTGAPLADAEVKLEVDGRPQALGYDATFPGGAFVAYGAGQPAGERYVFHITHDALGKTSRRLILHSRSFGSTPKIKTLPTRPPPHRPLPVAWHQVPWANFATVEVNERNPLTGLRRIWPQSLAGLAAASSPASVPAALLTPGRRLQVQVITGRADVRAENGEIWATGVESRDLTVTGSR